jgi:hypothetical protein
MAVLKKRNMWLNHLLDHGKLLMDSRDAFTKRGITASLQEHYYVLTKLIATLLVVGIGEQELNRPNKGGA